MKALVDISRNNWLQKIPTKWEIFRIKNLFQLSQEKNQGEDLPVLSLAQSGIRTRDISTNEGQLAESYENYTRIRPDDLVFNPMDLRSGAIDLSTYDGVISLAYSVLRKRSGVNIHLKYFKYYFQWHYLDEIFFPFGQGVSADHRWTLKDNILLNFPILFPPLETQKRIVDFLDEKTEVIDELVAKKERLIEKQRELIFSLVLGNDVKTKREIWGNVPNIWELQNAREVFMEVDVRNNPEEELLAVTQNRGVLPKVNLEAQFVSPTSNEGQKLVEKNDFVISLRSFEGGIEFSSCRGIVSPAYTILRLKDRYNTDLYQKYYKYLLKTPQFISYLNTIIMGIRDGKNISFHDFRDLILPVPPVNTIQSMLPEFEKYELLAHFLWEEKQLFNEYRSSLIYHAVTGKKKV